MFSFFTANLMRCKNRTVRQDIL